MGGRTPCKKGCRSFFLAVCGHETFQRMELWCYRYFGLVGDNNPHERTNLEIKGGKTFHGLINIGRDTLSMFTVELPQLVRNLSLLRVGVSRNLKIDNPDIVLHQQSKCCNELMRYYNTFDKSLDMKQIDMDSSGNIRFIVNTDDYLGEPVTTQRVEKYFKTLEGTMDVGYDQRHVMYEYVDSLCVVTKHDNKDGSYNHYGLCYKFLKQTYCNHCAILQYAVDLQSLGRAIPTNRKPRSSVRNMTITGNKWNLKSTYVNMASEWFKIHDALSVTFDVGTPNLQAFLSNARSTLKGVPNIIDLLEQITKMSVPHRKLERSNQQQTQRMC
jgi:hypothetical protein